MTEPGAANRSYVKLTDYTRCPKSDAGLCRKGGSWMFPASELEGGCDCPLVAWQVHCSCGWVSTPYPARRDARWLGRRHLKHWHSPRSHRFVTKLAADAT